MDTLKRQLVKLAVLAALALVASMLEAQGPPNACANACLQNYKASVVGLSRRCSEGFTEPYGEPTTYKRLRPCQTPSVPVV